MQKDYNNRHLQVKHKTQNLFLLDFMFDNN